MPYARCAALSAALVLGLLQGAGAQTAKAPILRDIEIDGSLDDWPEDMARYQVRTIWRRGDIKEVDLDRSADLGPQFRVGYDPQKDLVYVAVEVRDDRVVIGNNYNATDACEVYVDGRPDVPMQYVLVPGAGGSYLPGAPNPNLYRGDIYKTRTQAAYSRKGEVTIYEWAVEAFERYPDRSLELRPGARLLFDVVVVDKDAPHGDYAFVCWGPKDGAKYDGANRVGRLELTDEEVSKGLLAAMGSALRRAGQWLGMALVVLAAVWAGLAARRRVRSTGTAARLKDIEQRLTETQEVMIELSEKYDRLEEQMRQLTEKGE